MGQAFGLPAKSLVGMPTSHIGVLGFEPQFFSQLHLPDKAELEGHW